MRLKNAHIIWTVYIDRKLSRKRGRKIPIREAIKTPTLKELKEAAEKLGYKVLESKNANYPSCWWINAGYIAIEKTGEAKTKTIRKIAKEIRRKRGGG